MYPMDMTKKGQLSQSTKWHKKDVPTLFEGLILKPCIISDILNHSLIYFFLRSFTCHIWCFFNVYWIRKYHIHSIKCLCPNNYVYQAMFNMQKVETMTVCSLFSKPDMRTKQCHFGPLLMTLLNMQIYIPNHYTDQFKGLKPTYEQGP